MVAHKVMLVSFLKKDDFLPGITYRKNDYGNNEPIIDPVLCEIWKISTDCTCLHSRIYAEWYESYAKQAFVFPTDVTSFIAPSLSTCTASE